MYMHSLVLDMGNWMLILNNQKKYKEKQMPLWKEMDYIMSGFSYIKIKALSGKK